MPIAIVIGKVESFRNTVRRQVSRISTRAGISYVPKRLPRIEEAASKEVDEAVEFAETSDTRRPQSVVTNVYA